MKKHESSTRCTWQPINGQSTGQTTKVWSTVQS